MASPARSFVDAIAARDEDALKDALAPDVDFKGLTPRRLWEADSPDGVRDVVLGHWFEEQDRVTAVQDVTEGQVADTARIGYRLDLELPDGPYVVEQQAYYRSGPQGIDYLRIVCSGFRPRGGDA
jgi:hypothetical protein